MSVDTILVRAAERAIERHEAAFGAGPADVRTDGVRLFTSGTDLDPLELHAAIHGAAGYAVGLVLQGAASPMSVIGGAMFQMFMVGYFAAEEAAKAKDGGS